MINVKFPETNFVGCRFPQVTGRNGELVVDGRSKEYIYRLLPGTTRPNIGDMCVVSCSKGFQVAIVTSLDKSIPSDWDVNDMSNIVGFVDYQFYAHTLENKKKREALRQELMRKKKEMDEQFALELYAEKSPEFKELLDQYNSLC